MNTGEIQSPFRVNKLFKKKKKKRVRVRVRVRVKVRIGVRVRVRVRVRPICPGGSIHSRTYTMVWIQTQALSRINEVVKSLSRCHYQGVFLQPNIPRRSLPH